jgi:hypothetical protein
VDAAVILSKKTAAYFFLRAAFFLSMRRLRRSLNVWRFTVLLLLLIVAS